MIDLINRQTLLDMFDSFKDKKAGNPVIMRLDLVIKLIETVSNVDAEPVRHGAWVDDKCSVCKEYLTITLGDEEVKITNIKANYCPNCGAKMNEEADK